MSAAALDAIRLRYVPLAVRADDGDGDEFPLVLATEAPVLVGRGREILRMSGVDLTRYAQGGPLLDAHDASSVDRVLGSVRAVRVDGTLLRGVARFDDSPLAAKAKRLVRAGHLRGVSVGYRALRERRLAGGEVEVLEWELLEVSMVAVPADPDAGVRSAILTRALRAQETTMVHDDMRAAAIRALAPRGMESDAERLVAAGASVEAARGELLRLRRARPTPAPVVGRMADVSDLDLLASLRAAFGAAPRLMPRLSSPGVRFADVADEVLARSLRGGLGGSAA